MSEKILTTMYGVMRTNDESSDEYYVLQWTSELYILQEDKEMEGYTPWITAYTDNIVCDAVFLNPVPFAKKIDTHSCKQGFVMYQWDLNKFC